MQPWKISVGFTVIIIAIAGMIGGEHFAFVEPHFQIIATDYWMGLTWYGGAAIVSVMAVIYASAPRFGLGGPRPQGRSDGALYSARRRQRTHRACRQVGTRGTGAVPRMNQQGEDMKNKHLTTISSGRSAERTTTCCRAVPFGEHLRAFSRRPHGARDESMA